MKNKQKKEIIVVLTLNSYKCKNIDELKPSDIKNIKIYLFKKQKIEIDKEGRCQIEFSMTPEEIDNILNLFREEYKMMYHNPKYTERHGEYHYAYYVLKEAGISYSKIGRIFNRDHSSVLYAVDKIRGYINVYGTKWEIENINNIKYLFTESVLQVINKTNISKIEKERKQIEEIIKAINKNKEMLKSKKAYINYIKNELKKYE